MLVENISQVQICDRKFMVFNRESNMMQDKGLHHARAIGYLSKWIEDRGGEVVHTQRFNNPGWLGGGIEVYWKGIKECCLAMQCVPFAAAANRILRPRGYHSSKCFDLQASKEEWRSFDDVMWPLKAYTLVDPLASERVVSSVLTSIWTNQRKILIAPPQYLVGRSKLIQDTVHDMLWRGASLGEVSRECGIAKSTVQWWQKRWGLGGRTCSV